LGSQIGSAAAINESPNHIALDETVIRLNDEKYWLYTVVDPETNGVLHIRLYSTIIADLVEQFLQKLIERHPLDDAVFLVDGAKHIQTALR